MLEIIIRKKRKTVSSLIAAYRRKFVYQCEENITTYYGCYDNLKTNNYNAFYGDDSNT